MNLSRPAVPFKLEMMVLNVLQAVTHFGFSGAKGLAPEHAPIPFDRRGHRYRLEFRIDHKFRSEGTSAELRAREVQIVLLFKLMIRKLITHRKADSIRPAIRSDEINARDLGLLATVLGIPRNVERLSVGTYCAPCALGEPCGRDPDGACSRAAAVDAPAEHLHTGR